jgi:cellobiose phosphorylase
MYRIGIECLLGFTQIGDTLRIVPNVPGEWPSFTIRYRFRTATYVITVTSPAQVRGYDAIVTVDGEVSTDGSIRLVDDGREHIVHVQGSWRPSAE